MGSDLRLSDKVAVITGAGRGIGKAIALRFSDEGATIVASDVEFAYVESMANRLKLLGKSALALKADVSDVLDVKSMFEAVEREYGRVDILVNNAGVRCDVGLDRMSDGDWSRVIAVQLTGCFNCARAAQKFMVRQGYGKIISIAAPVPAALGRRGQVNYSAANAGIEGFTRALAMELGPYNVNVNCIAPEFIDTEMTRRIARNEGLYLDDLKRFVVTDVPLRRLGTPAEVASVALFLASDESSFVSGQTIGVRGGP